MKYLLLFYIIGIALSASAQTNLDSLRSKDKPYQVVVINGVEHKNDGVNAFIEPPDPYWEFGLADLRKLQADLKPLRTYDAVYDYMLAHRWQYISKTTDEITSLTEFAATFRKPNPHFVDPYATVNASKGPKTAKQKLAEEKAAKKAKEQKDKPEKAPKEKKPHRKFRVTDG